MNAVYDSCELTLEPADNAALANLCGQFDEHLRQIERHLGVAIANRGSLFRVTGPEARMHAGVRVLKDLFELAGRERIDAGRVHMSLQESLMDEEQQGGGVGGATAAGAASRSGGRGDDQPDAQSGGEPGGEPGSEAAGEAGEAAGRPASGLVKTRRLSIKARGRNQRIYIEGIRRHDLSFGIGPAGTGKTYLAVASAVEALESELVRRIVLVRPAVEAGERLGFLPGDMSQKVDPYLRPMYDALYDMLGFDRVARLIERHVIEVAPLAFMRGRSLNESFVLLDEAQNTTIEQMKMFLTRLGFGSKAVVTGDVTQVDLPRNQASGLKHVLKVLEGVEGVHFSFFAPSDVVRHALVQKIVEAYDRVESLGGRPQGSGHDQPLVSERIGGTGPRIPHRG